MCPPDGGPSILSQLLVGAALVGSCRSSPAPAPAPLHVAAASDLALVFEEMGRLYEARTGQQVTFSFGASGALAKQLRQGAPYDLFAAASPSYVDSAVAAGACDGRTKAAYARGHVVLWSKRADLSLGSLADLRSPRVKHIAIANPEHAPYGKAAKEILTRAGLWQELAAKIVQAENVRQAFQFAQTGNADAALVARSLVVKDNTGSTISLPTELHEPIVQTLVVCQGGRDAAGARRFAQLVASSEGQRLLNAYGLGASPEQVGEERAPRRP